MSDYLWSNLIQHAYRRQIVVHSAEDRQNDCRFSVDSKIFPLVSCAFVWIWDAYSRHSAQRFGAQPLFVFFRVSFGVCVSSLVWCFMSLWFLCGIFFPALLLRSHHIDAEYLCVCFWSSEWVEIVKRKELLWIMLSNSVLKFYCHQTEATQRRKYREKIICFFLWRLLRCLLLLLLTAVNMSSTFTMKIALRDSAPSRAAVRNHLYFMIVTLTGCVVWKYGKIILSGITKQPLPP